MVQQGMTKGVLRATSSGESWKFSIVGFDHDSIEQKFVVWKSYAELWRASFSGNFEDDVVDLTDGGRRGARLMPTEGEYAKRTNAVQKKALDEQARRGLTRTYSTAGAAADEGTPEQAPPPPAVSPDTRTPTPTSGINDVYDNIARNMAQAAREHFQEGMRDRDRQIEGLTRKLAEAKQARRRAEKNVEDAESSMRTLKRNYSMLVEENDELGIQNRVLQQKVDCLLRGD